MIDYSWQGDSVFANVELKTKKTLWFQAKDIRRERTGIHARITIGIKKTPLVWDVFNIERDEQRRRLSSNAHSHFSEPDAEAYSKQQLRHDFDTFCDGLWEFNVGSLVPQEISGDEDPKETQFVIEPWVVRGGGTILFAPPGSGKSYTAFLAAVSVDAGVHKLWNVIPAKTMIINLERSAMSMTKRLGMVNQVLGLPPTRSIVMMNARGRALKDVIESLKRGVDERAIDFAVLDSISRAGMGKMVQDDTGNMIMDALNGLCETWLALAHTPRADSTHSYGSVMFDAAADVVASLLFQEKRQDRVLGLAIDVHKANDVPKPNVEPFRLSFNGIGLVSAEKASPWEFPEIMSNRKMSMSEEVEMYLEQVGQASATDIANEIGRNRSNINTLLTRDDRFVITKKDGKKVLYGLKIK